MEEGIVRFLAENATAANATTFLKACADNIGLCWGVTLGGSLAVGAGLATVATCAFFKCRGRRLHYRPLGEAGSAFEPVSGPTEGTGLVNTGGSSGTGGSTSPRPGSSSTTTLL